MTKSAKKRLRLKRKRETRSLSPHTGGDSGSDLGGNNSDLPSIINLSAIPEEQNKTPEPETIKENSTKFLENFLENIPTHVSSEVGMKMFPAIKCIHGILRDEIPTERLWSLMEHLPIAKDIFNDSYLDTLGPGSAPTKHILDVEGIVDKDRNCGLCPIQISAGNIYRHLSMNHKVDKMKINDAVTRTKETKTPPSQCRNCGVYTTTLARHLKACVSDPTQDKVFKKAAKKVKQIPLGLNHFYSKTEEFLEDLKSKSVFSNLSNFDNRDLVDNLNRTARIFQNLGFNPNQIFHLTDHKVAADFSSCISAYHVHLCKSGKSPNTAKVYLNCVHRFVKWIYRLEQHFIPSILKEFPTYFADCKAGDAKRNNEVKYDFETGIKYVKLV